jgi:hypothetical protein
LMPPRRLINPVGRLIPTEVLNWNRSGAIIVYY